VFSPLVKVHIHTFPFSHLFVLYFTVPEKTVQCTRISRVSPKPWSLCLVSALLLLAPVARSSIAAAQSPWLTLVRRGCGSSVPAKAAPLSSPGDERPVVSSSSSFRKTKRQTTTTFSYERSQKTLDDKVIEGLLERQGSRGRRAGVVGENTSAMVSRQSTRVLMDAASQGAKDPATRAMLRKAIDGCILFNEMSESQRDLIIDVMVAVQTTRDEVVIQQGEMLSGGATDNFYVVDSGTFHIFRDMRANNHAVGWKPPAISDAISESLASKMNLRPEEAKTVVSRFSSWEDSEHVKLVQMRERGDAFGELGLMYAVNVKTADGG